MSNNLRKLQRANKQADQVTVKLGVLHNSQPALGTLLAQPVGARLAFQLAKTARAIAVDLTTLEEQRIRLCEQHGTKDEQSGKYKIRPAEQAEFDQQINELFNTEVTLSIPQIKLEELNGVQVSAAHLMLLDWLIVEG